MSESLEPLVTSNVEYGVQDRAENVHRTVLVLTVFVLAVIVIVVTAVRTVLVTALESLLEIVLVLVPGNAGLVAVGSASINAGVCPTVVPVAASIGPARLETLSVAFVNGLLKHLRSPVVRVVIRTISVNAISGVLIPIAGSVNNVYTLGIPAVICDLALLRSADLVVVSRPLGLTLLLQPDAFLLGLCILLILFFPLMVRLFVVLVMIAVALGAYETARSEHGDQS